MRRLLLTLLGLLALAALLVWILAPGSDVVQGVRIAFRSTFQEEPDYDALEADRAARAAASRTAPPNVPPKVPDDRVGAPPPYWTDFRGPGRRGVYDEAPVADAWPDEGLPLLWRQPVGAGYGSVTVAEGLVFSLEQRRDEEALVAYDLDTGAEVWIDAWPARFDELMSGEGPRTTPVYADGAVYALGATGELRRAAAATGALEWRLDALAADGAENLAYGLAATPLVAGELLVVASAGAVLGVERATGEVRWRALEERGSYASPLPARVAGRDQVVVATGTRVAGIDPADGAVLWSAPWQVAQELTCSQPIPVGADALFLSGGYGKGAALVRVAEGAGGFAAGIEWQSLVMKNRFNSSVLVGGHVYGLDEGILACVEPLSGARLWKGGRYGYGQLIAAGDDLIVVGEDGELALVTATPEGHDERHRFQALEGLTFNVPAAAHGRLFLRNKLELCCYALSAGPRSR